MKRILKPFSGPLTPQEVLEGINAAQTNALRLLDDAKLLMEAGRYPSAAALAILSIEERGKVIILKNIVIVSNPDDLKEAWRNYRSHKAKNSGWIIPELARQGAKTLEAMAAAVDPNAEHTKLLDSLKQVSFYSDCLGNRNWSRPNDVIDEECARSMVATAELMWGARSVTLRELELWKQIVGPHYKKSSMASAVVQWQRQMFAEELSEVEPEKLAAFMQGTGFQADDSGSMESGKNE